MVKKKCVILGDNGSKIVSPENILDIHDNLSVSLNPTEQFYNEPNRFKMWSSFIYKYLKDRIKYSSLKLYPELSGKGRLHMHGYIHIEDKGNFYLHDVPYLVQLGNTEIDTICHRTCDHTPMVNEEDTLRYDCGIQRWAMYVRKQQDMMRPFTDQNLLYSEGVMSLN